MGHNAGAELYHDLKAAFSLQLPEERAYRVGQLILPAIGDINTQMVSHPLDFNCIPVLRTPDGIYGVCVHLRDCLDEAPNPSSVNLKEHNHPWDLDSLVVDGRGLINRLLTLTHVPKPMSTHQMVRAVNKDGMDFIDLQDDHIIISSETQTLHTAGTVYSMPAGDFHESIIPDTDAADPEPASATIVLARTRPGVTPLGLVSVEYADQVQQAAATRSLYTVAETLDSAQRFAHSISHWAS